MRWLLLAALGARAFAAPITLGSPNHSVEFRVWTDAGGQLRYSADFHGRAAIEDSPLGITADGVNLADGVQMGPPELYRVHETYPWYGVHSTATDDCQGIRIPLTHLQSHTAYTLEARAYDDGIAFRQIVPGGDRARVPDEATAFHLARGSVVWYHDFHGHYGSAFHGRDLPEWLGGSTGSASHIGEFACAMGICTNPLARECNDGILNSF